MKESKKIILVLKAVCTLLIWCLAVCAMFIVFREKSEPLYGQVGINEIPDGKLFLRPQDTLCQAFGIKTDNLQGVALAFDYDDAAAETGTLLVRFYFDDTMIIEQPLPFLACPQGTFMEFSLGLFGEGILTVEIKNTSENADCVLSILDTSDFYAYRDFSEGYRLNDGAITNSSILCDFKYREGYDYYKGLTCAFQVFLVTIMLLCLLKKGGSWLKQRF